MNFQQGANRTALVGGIGGGLLGLGLAPMALVPFIADALKRHWVTNSDFQSDVLSWLVCTALPLVGFLVPWCILKCILKLVGWIIAGFTDERRESNVKPKAPLVERVSTALKSAFVRGLEHGGEVPEEPVVGLLDEKIPKDPIAKIYWALAGIYAWYSVVCLTLLVPSFGRSVQYLEAATTGWVWLAVLVGWLVVMAWLIAFLGDNNGSRVDFIILDFIFAGLLYVLVMGHLVLSFEMCKADRRDTA